MDIAARTIINELAELGNLGEDQITSFVTVLRYIEKMDKLQEKVGERVTDINRKHNRLEDLLRDVSDVVDQYTEIFDPGELQGIRDAVCRTLDRKLNYHAELGILNNISGSVETELNIYRGHLRRLKLSGLRDEETTVSPGICKICLDKTINIVIVPCRHTCCSTCTDRLMAERTQVRRAAAKCPFCNGEFIEVESVYL